MKELRLKALAKINLGLDVLRRREDGYHEVKMVMQTIRLYDRLILKKTDRPGIQVKTNLYYLPANENNLVYQAAKLLQDEFDLKSGMVISLRKFIPVAAGMAGGSSDAAAVLYGMNRMFQLQLSREELMKLGVRIGAEYGRTTCLTVLCGGRLWRKESASSCPHCLPCRNARW